jgi:ferrous iron transport protein A
VSGVDLTQCGAGARATIVGVDVPAGAGFRLRELGLRPGAVVQVTHDVGPMGRVVAVGAERFALDLPTCASVRVEVVP